MPPLLEGRRGHGPPEDAKIKWRAAEGNGASGGVRGGLMRPLEVEAWAWALPGKNARRKAVGFR